MSRAHWRMVEHQLDLLDFRQENATRMSVRAVAMGPTPYWSKRPASGTFPALGQQLHTKK